MAEALHDGEFWLPSQFLTDDDNIFMEKHNNNNNNNNNNSIGFNNCSKKEDFVKPLFPFEYSGFGVSSDLSSPATETESDEEDYYLAGLTRQMAHSTLNDDDFSLNGAALGAENSKCWVLSGSPQSTLCGCTKASSPPPPPLPPAATWDLLYAAAGEVARMKLKEEAYYGLSNHDKELFAPPRKPSPASVPPKNHNNVTHDFGLYHHQHHSLSYLKLQAPQFQHLRQQQMMKQKQQNQQAVLNRANSNGNKVPLGLSASAWPPLQSAHQHQQNNSGMRAVFLGNPAAAKRECAGTGVFLPRRAGLPSDPPRKKPGCSTVLMPARVVQALNLNLDEIGAQPQLLPRFNGNYNLDTDAGLRFRNNNIISNQKRNLRPQQQGMNNELRLPQEWTY